MATKGQHIIIEGIGGPLMAALGAGKVGEDVVEIGIGGVKIRLGIDEENARIVAEWFGAYAADRTAKRLEAINDAIKDRDRKAPKRPAAGRKRSR